MLLLASGLALPLCPHHTGPRLAGKVRKRCNVGGMGRPPACLSHILFVQLRHIEIRRKGEKIGELVFAPKHSSS